MVTKTFPPSYFPFLLSFFLLYYLLYYFFIFSSSSASRYLPQAKFQWRAGLSVLDKEELTWGKLPLISGTYRKSTPNKARRASGARHLVSIG